MSQVQGESVVDEVQLDTIKINSIDNDKIEFSINEQNVSVNDINYLTAKIAYFKLQKILKDKEKISEDDYYMLNSDTSKNSIKNDALILNGWKYITFRKYKPSYKLYLYKINKNDISENNFDELFREKQTEFNVIFNLLNILPIPESIFT